MASITAYLSRTLTSEKWVDGGARRGHPPEAGAIEIHQEPFTRVGIERVNTLEVELMAQLRERESEPEKSTLTSNPLIKYWYSSQMSAAPA